jgi:hypothetical protein
MRLLRSYLFRNKDPEIDRIRTLIQERHKTTSAEVLEQIADDGGPTAGTLHAWFHGKTLRPQNATLEAAGRALGMQRVWVKLGKTRP